MRRHAAIHVTACLLCLCCPVVGRVSAADLEAGKRPLYSELVGKALEAELAGDNAKRQDWLAAALRSDPEDLAARWHAGFIRVEDQWLELQAAEEQAAEQGLVFEYRKLRDRYAGTADGQVALARWCRKNKLPEYERVHWAAVLSFDRTNREARSRLATLERGEVQLRKAQAEEYKQTRRARQAAIDRWREQLRRWRKAMEGTDAMQREDAFAAFRMIDDINALPAIYEVFSGGSDELLLEAVDVISAMKGQLATDLLVKYALSAESEAIRDAAAAELGKRSQFGFVPALLAAMRATTEFEYYVSAYRDLVSYGIVAISDSPSGQVAVEQSFTNVYLNRAPGGAFQGASHLSFLEAQQKQNRLAQMARSVEESNEELLAWNAHVAHVLRLATHQKQLDNQAQTWWQWWQDQNHLYSGRQRPTKSIKNHRVMANLSCFLAGTTVSTATGPVNIERIRVGDQVLSQNVWTGELGYRSVLQTTIRPPSPTTRIVARGEEIVATLGHPLWVNGIGWLMAKECLVGDKLHSVHGGVEIDHIEPGPEAEAYNLVVGGWNSYFVGSHRVLVHDNQPRRVTEAVLPGYVRESREREIECLSTMVPSISAHESLGLESF